MRPRGLAEAPLKNDPGATAGVEAALEPPPPRSGLAMRPKFSVGPAEGLLAAFARGALVHERR